MYLRRDELTRTVRAPAKLNVYLEVLGRRNDGFHELETLIVPIRLWDSLTFESTGPARDAQPGPILFAVRSCLPARQPFREQDLPPVGESNLVVRALELLRARSGCCDGARIELTKRIPLGAGLGGGSSDAAAALRAANRLWRLDWGRSQLAELAAEIGSDVPFFLQDGPAICRGRGDHVETLAAVAPLYFVIVKPPVALSTAEVYQVHDALNGVPDAPVDKRLAELVRNLSRGGVQEIGRWMVNRLEAAAAHLTPWIDELRRLFSQLDCLGHQLSGSGSAYFAVCRHAQHARRVAAFLRTRQLGLVYATCSCATRSC